MSLAHAAEITRLRTALATAEQERDAAVADNAALTAWVNYYGHAEWCPQNHNDKLEGCHEACAAHPVFSDPHPGATLLEQHRKEVERLTAALADIQRKAENWGHGEDCSAEDDEAPDENCACGKAEVLEVLNPKDGSLPGAVFLARRDSLAKELEAEKTRFRNVLERLAEEVSHFTGKPCAADFMAVLSGLERVAKRARNEGLEKVAQELINTRDRVGSPYTKQGTRRGGLEEAAFIVRARKEPEE